MRSLRFSILTILLAGLALAPGANAATATMDGTLRDSGRKATWKLAITLPTGFTARENSYGLDIKSPCGGFGSLDVKRQVADRLADVGEFVFMNQERGGTLTAVSAPARARRAGLWEAGTNTSNTQIGYAAFGPIVPTGRDRGGYFLVNMSLDVTHPDGGIGDCTDQQMHAAFAAAGTMLGTVKFSWKLARKRSRR